jgi:hypothetical protein
MEGDIKRLKELYENDMYLSVQSEAVEILRKYEDVIPDYLKMEVEAYSVFSGILLTQNDVDGLVSEYEAKYPHAPQLSVIKFYHSV